MKEVTMLAFLTTVYLSTGQILQNYRQATYSYPKYKPILKIEQCIEYAKLKEERLRTVIENHHYILKVNVECKRITKQKWNDTRIKK